MPSREITCQTRGRASELASLFSPIESGLRLQGSYRYSTISYGLYHFKQIGTVEASHVASVVTILHFLDGFPKLREHIRNLAGTSGPSFPAVTLEDGMDVE